MTEYENGYQHGFDDGRASKLLPNIIDNGDKIDGYSYMYKTDSIGEPYIHIDSVRNMLKKAANQPVKGGIWITAHPVDRSKEFKCTACQGLVEIPVFAKECYYDFCPNCGARMKRGRWAKVKPEWLPHSIWLYVRGEDDE